jgi:SAM-dependent methyltransferase
LWRDLPERQLNDLFSSRFGRRRSAQGELRPPPVLIAERLAACETDADCGQWVAEHAPFAEVQVCGSAPPLTFGEHTFDLVHARVDHPTLAPELAAWASEIHRILAPGGVLVLSGTTPLPPARGHWTAAGLEPVASRSGRIGSLVLRRSATDTEFAHQPSTVGAVTTVEEVQALIADRSYGVRHSHQEWLDSDLERHPRITPEELAAMQAVLDTWKGGGSEHEVAAGPSPTTSRRQGSSI